MCEKIVAVALKFVESGTEASGKIELKGVSERRGGGGGGRGIMQLLKSGILKCLEWNLSLKDTSEI